MTEKSALALFSGGLDSTLACRLIAAQGIRVKAIKFVSPFFDYGLLARENEYVREIEERYKIDVRLFDITEKYLKLLRDPPHGFGRNFNPCIDCKILLLSEARQMMEEFGASFIITGEVVGQRPMSQRHDTLRLIERESGCTGLLLRPLCAKRLAPTVPETSGLVDRELLLGFSGRSRMPQIKLAEDFNIRDYPSPAGGCLLTDPIMSGRIKNYYRQSTDIRAEDIRLLLVGRQFSLPSGAWLALGRDHQDNCRIQDLYRDGDYLLLPRDIPGPTGLLRYCRDESELRLAAGLLLRYIRKSRQLAGPLPVQIYFQEKKSELQVEKLADQDFQLLPRFPDLSEIK